MNLTDILLKWYDENKRNLAWRETKDPYKIWVSEIILQQTRVEQGTDYYLKFLDFFPTLNDLAIASRDEVLKVWEGLGYYRRAVNMHITAEYLKKNNQGKFPEQYSELIKLKGIGDYTAAAIASLAFDEPVVAIDGNVMRFMARYFGIYNNKGHSDYIRQLKKAGDEIIDRNDPGKYNQAMIEFGALQCIPGNPGCSVCPLNFSCYAYSRNKVQELPVKKKNKKVRERYFYYFLLLEGNHIYIKKREDNDIWAGLYDFPLIETDKKMTTEQILAGREFYDITNNHTITLLIRPVEKKHILSHQIIKATFYVGKINFLKEGNHVHYIKVPVKSLENYSLPRLIGKFIASETIRNILNSNNSKLSGS